MNLRNAKIYSDGSHYIAIPYQPQPHKRRKPQRVKTQIDTKVEKIYKETKGRTKDKIESITKEINKEIQNEDKAKEMVEQNIFRLKRNMIERRKRLARKVYLQDWDYFCTFTYDSTKLTEEEFRIKFKNCLKHLSNRKGWKYVGVWERSPQNNRLHFHGLFYTPIMIGKFEEIKDYSTKAHKMQVANQNTFFLRKFGRNDFQPMIKTFVSQSVQYMMKYILKTGEKIVYSKGLPTYFNSDILEEDVVCTIGQEDRKLLLFDNFTCLIEGEIIGQVSRDTIDKMPKSN